MIAAAAQSLELDKLPVNWFDGLLLVTLAFGLFRGRKNGMSKELLPTAQWLALVLACGFGYGLVSQFFSNTGGLDTLWSGVLGYLGIAMLVLIVFSFIKKALAPRLAGSNVFGNGEYYLGMPSGMIRFTCILFFALALLNAPFYTVAEIQKTKAYNERWYGGGIYSGSYFPDLHTIQEGVFINSFTGPYIKNYLDPLLIETAPAGGTKQQPNQLAQPKKQPMIHIGQ